MLTIEDVKTAAQFQDITFDSNTYQAVRHVSSVVSECLNAQFPEWISEELQLKGMIGATSAEFWDELIQEVVCAVSEVRDVPIFEIMFYISLQKKQRE